jgi:hypothetical protein
MERTNQILEDMLRVCALRYGKSWDKSLPYTEFSYNNSYQASIEMAPFVRRAMRIKEEISHLKFVILYTLRFSL